MRLKLPLLAAACALAAVAAILFTDQTGASARARTSHAASTQGPPAGYGDFSIFSRPASANGSDPFPAVVTAANAGSDMDLTDAQEVVVGRTDMWLVPKPGSSADGNAVCLVVEGSGFDSKIFGGCTGLSSADSTGEIVTGQSQSGGYTVFGLVPDGVAAASLTTATGVTSAAVTNNSFSVTLSSPPTLVTTITRSGNRRSARVPR
jgi:hypothetical protein